MRGAAREIFLVWSAGRRLLPATDLFRRHVLGRAAAAAPRRRLIPNGPGACRSHPIRGRPYRRPLSSSPYRPAEFSASSAT